MNNIKLTSNYDGTFDWSFNRRDIDNCNGVDAIISSCKHVILLRYNELIQSCYNEKGNLAWDYLREKASNTNLSRIEEATRIELKSVEGVKDATVTAVHDNTDISLETVIMLDNGLEVELNGI